MRVLVTGGAGFIGSHLCDALLARGDEVFVVDDLSGGRKGRLDGRVALYKDTILDATRFGALVKEIEPELICHLAAQVDVRESVAFPAMDAQVNVIGTVNVLDAARSAGARVVFCSSGGALYGEEAPVPTPESVPPVPESPYGIAKLCAEHYVGLYNRLYGTEHAIVRFANVYGPRQDPAREAGVISIFCSSAIAGRPLTIFGDGMQTRDYVYVRDCVAAILGAADSGKGGTWNIGTGTETTILDLVAVINRITDIGEPEFAPPRKGELQRSALDASLARSELAWHPGTSLADGVRAVYEWIKQGASDRAQA